LRRLDAALRDRPADVGRPVRGHRQVAVLHLLLLLDPRDAAAAALRPAHVVRLEDPAAPGHGQRARHGGPGGGSRLMPYDPGDVVEVVRVPPPGPARDAYRAFGETLRGLRTTFKKFVETPQT